MIGGVLNATLFVKRVGPIIFRRCSEVCVWKCIITTKLLWSYFSIIDFIVLLVLVVCVNNLNTFCFEG
jgi:hypothetical protein